jgi:carboxypeptidase D
MYIPYIADAMLNSNDTTYYNLQGTLLYDASIHSNSILKEVPVVDFVNKNSQLLGSMMTI